MDWTAFFAGLTAKDVVGPAATVVAALGAVLATYLYNRRQLKIAAEKLRLDLFDKRTACLLAAVETKNKILNAKWWKIVDGDAPIPDLLPFSAHLEGTPFLFPNEMDVRAAMMVIHDRFALHVRESIVTYHDWPRDKADIKWRIYKWDVIDEKFEADLIAFRTVIRPYVQFQSY